MTAVLNRQADAANTLLHRFTDLDRATDNYDPSGQFISANSAIAEMNANLGVQTTLLQQQNPMLANLAEQTANAAREADKSKSAWDSVGTAIKAALSFLSVKAVKDFTDSVFGLSNTQLKAEVQLGKALDGTYDGLKKKGFELTEEQQEIIENGTDMQKALVLDDVINQSWEGLAENMRNTPTGAITSLNNTIGDIGETIGARITPAFMALAERVDVFVNSAGFQDVIDTLVASLSVVFDVLSAGAAVVQWAADNWSVLGPVLFTVVGALAAYKAVSLAATAAQWLLNGAWLACPVTWVVLAILALVGILAVVINAINSCTGSSLSLGGVIGGSLMVALAALGNAFIWIANVGVGVWEWMYALCENIPIAFHNAIASVQSWWYSLLSTVLTVVEGICEALNKIPFIEFDYSGVSNAAADFAAKSAEAAGNKQEYKDLGAAFDKGFNTFEYMNLGDAWNAGYSMGDGLFSSDSSSVNGYDPTALLFDDQPAGTADDPIHTSVDNDVNIADEDLQLMRDVAEARYVQNFVTLTPTVQVSGNTINEKVDVNTVVDEIENRLANEIAASAEGIYG